MPRYDQDLGVLRAQVAQLQSEVAALQAQPQPVNEATQASYLSVNPSGTITLYGMTFNPGTGTANFNGTVNGKTLGTAAYYVAAYGTAVFSVSGQTSVSYSTPHGLGKAPSWTIATPVGSTVAGITVGTTADATNITIYVNALSTMGGSLNVNWMAIV